MRHVEKTEFWDERIAWASSIGQNWRSVYDTHAEDWKRIQDTHKQIIAERIPENAEVLDAGCGYGRLSPLFDNYTGVDLVPSFVDWAVELHPDKYFLVSDLKDLPFEDNAFDWAICSSIKQMIVANKGNRTWDKMEKELKRVAKNVLILEYSEPDKHEVL